MEMFFIRCVQFAVVMYCIIVGTVFIEGDTLLVLKNNFYFDFGMDVYLHRHVKYRATTLFYLLTKVHQKYNATESLYWDD